MRIQPSGLPERFRYFLTAAILIITCLQLPAQTVATDFTVNDCGGNSQHLFDELDTGKIVVLVWAMPCGSCVGPTLGAASVVQKFAGSHPGKVLFWLADDLADTSCSTLSLWAQANGIRGATYFSSTKISMWDYGIPGMPKVVALAGGSHKVIFNQNNGLNVTSLTNAINEHISTGMEDGAKLDFNLSVYPNPMTGNLLTVSCTLDQPSELGIALFNALGSEVLRLTTPELPAGTAELPLSTGGLSNGIYFLRISGGDKVRVIKLIAKQE